MKRAFTILEMLVVIGVIALLGAVLVPVVGRARVAANRAACGAQLGRIGHAFEMYLNDSRGRLPRVNPLPGVDPPASNGVSVCVVFEPYLHDGARRVWRCPADPGRVFEAYGVSYEYNTFMNAMFGGRMYTEALAWVKRPPLGIGADRARVLNDFEAFHGRAGVRGNMNFLFADWHVGDLP